MKNYIAILALSALMTTPAFAQEHKHQEGNNTPHMEGHAHAEHMAGQGNAQHADHEAMRTVRQVETAKVCMVNDTAFDTE